MTDQKKTLQSSTCSAASEASASDLKQPELFKLSDSVSKTSSAKPSSESTGPTRQFTTTLEPSQQMDIEELTSSAVAFHASHGAWPGSSEAQKMTVISGRKCCELLKLYKVDGLLAKMCVDLLMSQWASSAAFLTWKASATKPRHLLFQLAPSMPRTDATESGLWPTPTTQEIEHPNMELSETGRRLTKDKKNSHSLNLADSVKMWPTPTTRDYKDTGDSIMVGKVPVNGLLGRAVSPSREHGSLNPTWVEWLMGFPTGHTELRPWEIPSSRKSLKKSGAQSSRQNNNETR